MSGLVLRVAVPKIMSVERFPEAFRSVAYISWQTSVWPFTLSHLSKTFSCLVLTVQKTKAGLVVQWTHTPLGEDPASNPGLAIGWVMLWFCKL